MFQILLPRAFSITVYVFLCIIIVGTICFLFLKDDSEKSKNLQKVIGGLSIFVLAIIANNGWVYSLSVFVGGLIIASEDFMKFFAAIMRTSGDKVAETVNALKTGKATPMEVSEKIQTEVSEDDSKTFEYMGGNDLTPVEVTHTEQRTPKFGVNDRVNERLVTTRRIEDLVQQTLIETYGSAYESNMKITRGDKSLIVDGILRSKKKILRIIEIKYFNQNIPSALKFIILRLKEKLSKLGITKKLMIVTVSDTMTKEMATQIFQENGESASFMFYKFYPDKYKLEQIFIES